MKKRGNCKKEKGKKRKKPQHKQGQDCWKLEVIVSLLPFASPLLEAYLLSSSFHSQIYSTNIINFINSQHKKRLKEGKTVTGEDLGERLLKA